MAKGVLYINGADAYTTWGVSLDDQGLSVLMTPAGQKDLITNTSRLEHGKRVINATPRVTDRELNLGFNLVAPTAASFAVRYADFCEQLKTGQLLIKTKYQPDIVYKLNYISCSSFAQYSQGLAKFTLRLNEPNPEDRTEE